MKHIDTQDLGDLAQAQFAAKFFFENGEEKVHADRDPDLGLHRVVGVAIKRLDAQMLAQNASPGGAADLLAATLFLDRVSA